jgi:DNA processing protein
VTEREAYIALNLMSDVGPVGVRSLVDCLGSAAAIFTADRGALLSAERVGPALAGRILSQRESVDVAGEVARAESLGLRVVTRADEDYPRALLTIHDPPLALYVQGRFDSRDAHALAVVGTRRPSHYGRDCAERFAGAFARMGYTVVSGLAEGVDTVAHEAALKAGGRTLAVIGSGFGHLYPESNRGLAERIAGHGAVLSEFPLDRRPDKTTFPMRNRVVSGLSEGVLVVEAGLNSGALITARVACEQGRQVFAIPGRIDSAPSQGCNRLIREGATLVEAPDDVSSEFEALFSMPTARPAVAAPVLGADETRVLDLLADGERDVDALIRESGLGAGGVNAVLIGLEMKRLVRMLPGRMVTTVRTAGC